MLTWSPKQFTVIAYNPSAQPRTVQIHIPVTGSSYTIVNVIDNGIASQVRVHPEFGFTGCARTESNVARLHWSTHVACFQLMPVSNVTRHLPERAGSKATADLVFEAKLPALGFTTYQISSASSSVYI